MYRIAEYENDKFKGVVGAVTTLAFTSIEYAELVARRYIATYGRDFRVVSFNNDGSLQFECNKIGSTQGE